MTRIESLLDGIFGPRIQRTNGKTLSLINTILDLPGLELWILDDTTIRADYSPAHTAPEHEQDFHSLPDSLRSLQGMGPQPIVFETVEDRQYFLLPLNDGISSHATLVGCCATDESGNWQSAILGQMSAVRAAATLALATIRMQEEREHQDLRIRQLLRQQELLQFQHARVTADNLEERNERLEEQASYLQRLKGEVESRTKDLTARTQELERKNHELTEAKELADLANQAKSQFLSKVSHELRTPLTAIIGFADLMLDPEFQDAGLDIVRRIRSGGLHLLGIINDLLDLSKIEGGRLATEIRPCSLPGLLVETAAVWKPRAREKGLELTIQLDSPIPTSVETDPHRLKQALSHLLDNAIKYSTSGEITLAVRTDPLRMKTFFQITDTGVGIPTDSLSKIYDPFVQVDDSLAREYGGIGLGLAITRKIVRLLGGQMTLDSVVGTGTKCTFSIGTGNVSGIPTVSTLDTEGIALPCEIRGSFLVVEDSDDNQKLIRMLLTKAGATVNVAVNGKVGVQAALGAIATGHPFDIILMDIQMPVMDGYEATRRLREQSYRGQIIALTAHDIPGERERCLAAGCDGYMTKPIQRTRFLDELAIHLRRSRVTI